MRRAEHLPKVLPLAAFPPLSEKPRLGVATWKSAPNPGIEPCKSTNALGLRGSLHLLGVGPSEHDGSYDITNPQSLNRYAYALNNPLSLIDPSGRLSCYLIGSDTWSVSTPYDTSSGSDPGSIVCLDDGGEFSGGEFSGGGGGGGGGAGAPSKVSKSYGTTIPCTSSASDVMNFVQSSFGTFGNYSRLGGLESVLFSPSGGLSVGSTIPIGVETFGIFQNLSVNVAAMNSQSMTFTTNPGHLLYPASITFSASPASSGSINFNINLGGTVASPLQFSLGGSGFEDAQWNHFLGQVGNFCKEE